MAEFTPNGKGHWLLRRLSAGPMRRDALNRAAIDHFGPSKGSKIRYVVGLMQEGGRVVHHQKLYELTPGGRDLLDELDRAAGLVPNIRIFARAEPAHG